MAEFKSTGVQIAAKKIYDEETAKMTIKKEVDILKKCNHPNIVNYFGCLIPGSAPDGEKEKDTKDKKKGEKKDEKKSPVLSPLGGPKEPVWVKKKKDGRNEEVDFFFW